MKANKTVGWIALPVCYSNPQWIETGNSPEQSDKIQVN